MSKQAVGCPVGQLLSSHTADMVLCLCCVHVCMKFRALKELTWGQRSQGFSVQTLCKIGAKKSNSSRYFTMATEIFLNNANGPSNHHTKFEIFPIYYRFSWNKRFSHRFVLWLAHFSQPPWENHLLLGFLQISSRSENSQTWCDDCLFKKISVAIAICLAEFNLWLLFRKGLTRPLSRDRDSEYLSNVNKSRLGRECWTPIQRSAEHSVEWHKQK